MKLLDTRIETIYQLFCGMLISAFTLGLINVESAQAQISSSNAFLQGDFAEAGIAPNGSFGSTVNAPGGYHARPGTISGETAGTKLGFVVDRGKDGWATGTPVYDGDFFLPGSPQEQWSVTVGGTTSVNGRPNHDTNIAITGSLSNYVANSALQSVDWTGSIGDLGISKTHTIEVDDTEINISVTLTNNGVSTLSNVYYLRLVDADNNQTLGSTGFSTTNSVESQAPDSPVALVSSSQSDGSYIALRAADSRAKAARACGSVFSPATSGESVYAGTGVTLTGSAASDTPICLAFNLGNIAPSASVTFEYQYTLSTPTYDFGDAPSPYATLQSAGGARHLIVDGGIKLGTNIDSESDGQPSTDADGDDTTGSPDDEDGVSLTGTFSPGATISVAAISNASGKLNGWVDYNRDGDWNDSGEQVFDDVSVTASTNNLNFVVPTQITPGVSYARFRLDTAGGVGPTGTSADGEVEDYKVTLQTSTASGKVYDDANGNGSIGGGETGYQNVLLSVFLDDGDNVFEPGAGDGSAVFTSLTDSSGDYSFSSLAVGTYWIRLTDPSDVIDDNDALTDGSNPTSVTVASVGQTFTGNDFGYGPGTDTDGDGVPDAVEGSTDTDGDGVTDDLDLDADDDGVLDSVECPSGVCSDTDSDTVNQVKQWEKQDFALRSPIYAAWNSNLSQLNVATLQNPGSSPQTVTVELFSKDGASLGSSIYGVPGKGQFDVILNGLSGFPTDDYGLVKLSFSGGSFDGHMGYYRPRGNPIREAASTDPYEFSFLVPFQNSRQGVLQGFSNMYQPSTDSASQQDEVAHWVQIMNTQGTDKTFTVKLYNDAGTEVASKPVTVPANGRRDVSAGHTDFGLNSVALVEVIPSDLSTLYAASLFAYGADAPATIIPSSFSFAMGSQLKPGSARTQYVTVTGGRNATSWVQIANTGTSSGSVIVSFIDRAGTVAETETLTLGAKAQIHIRGETYFETGDTGLVKIEPQSTAKFTGQSIAYHRDTNGHVLTTALLASREATSGTKVSAYNTFWDQLHWLKLFSTSGSPQSVTITAYGIDGTAIGSSTVSVNSLSSKVLELGIDTDIPVYTGNANGYGIVEITSSDTSPLIAEVLRVRGEGVDGVVEGADVLPLR